MARLLLVDDDPAGVELRRLILTRLGYVCAVALDREQAMRLLLETKPELIVLDLRLPALDDGLALIREIHAASPAGILVLSGFPGDLHGRPEAALVHGVLSKPVRPEKLVLQISELLTSRGPEPGTSPER